MERGKRWDKECLSTSSNIFWQKRACELTLSLLTSLPHFLSQSAVYLLSSSSFLTSSCHRGLTQAISEPGMFFIIFNKPMFIPFSETLLLALSSPFQKRIASRLTLTPFSLPSELLYHLPYCTICLVYALVWFCSPVSTHICISVLLNSNSVLPRKRLTAPRILL